MSTGTKRDPGRWLKGISVACTVMWGVALCAALGFGVRVPGPMLLFGLPAAFILAAVASLPNKWPGTSHLVKATATVVCGVILGLLGCVAFLAALYFALHYFFILVATVFYWLLH
jgi:hypothetical protein